MTKTFPIQSNLSSPGLGRYVKLSQFRFERDINRSMQHGLELNRVSAGSGKPGKSLMSPGTWLLVQESSGNMLNSREIIMYGRQ